MIKRLLLSLSLFISSMAIANIPEAQAAQLEKDIEARMQLIQAVGGFYLLSISNIPAAQIKTITMIMQTAAQSELCVDYRSDEATHLLVFCGPEGAQEAQGLNELLTKKGCQVELLELV